MALLQRVERALRNEDPALVSSLLNELDTQHPRGVLSEERQAARVMAHCQAKEPSARLAAERFLRAMPNSVYTDRVRSLCDLK
jgi:outer membrane protein assembly factor BamD (BamD/ComL family)